MNYLYYDTPVDQFNTYYAGKNQPYKTTTQSLLPDSVALIRLVAALIFTAISAVIAMVTQRPLVFAGSLAAFGLGITAAGLTIYNLKNKKDHLVEAFYEIVGGKEKFEKLPEFKVAGKDFFEIDQIEHYKWSTYLPISRATTVDGRKVLVAKCLSREPKETKEGKVQVKATMVFIEKMGHDDFYHSYAKGVVTFYKVLWALGVPMSKVLNGLWEGSPACYVTLSNEISAELANELRAQLT